MADPLTVVSFLWRDPEYGGPAYTARHVNAWVRMIDAHLSMPHRFVLITDQPEGAYDPRIEIKPLWDDFPWARRLTWCEGGPLCFRRLKLFDRETALQFVGPRWVWIDLDVVVFDQLDSLFDTDADFKILDHESEHKLVPQYQGSLVLSNAGARQGVWDVIRQYWDTPERLRAMCDARVVGNDQAILSAILGRGEAKWTRKDGIWKMSDLQKEKRLTRHRARRLGVPYQRGPRPVICPVDARLIFSNGWTNKPWSVGMPDWFRQQWERYADAE